MADASGEFSPPPGLQSVLQALLTGGAPQGNLANLPPLLGGPPSHPSVLSSLSPEMAQLLAPASKDAMAAYLNP